MVGRGEGGGEDGRGKTWEGWSRDDVLQRAVGQRKRRAPMAQQQRVETHASLDGEDKRPRQGTAANRGVFRAASWISMAFLPAARGQEHASSCPASSAEMRAVTDLGGRGPLAAVLRAHRMSGREVSQARPSLHLRPHCRRAAVQTCSRSQAMQTGADAA